MALALCVPASAGAIIDAADIPLIDDLVGPAGEHCEGAIAGGDFETIFICGDEFFEFSFNAVDGGGANVGDGGRYTRVPRADLMGVGEWADHFPERPTGPNAAGCVSCHATPVGTSAGPAEVNVIRDPLHSADPGMFIQRNTPHLMGSGALQLLAEEITAELKTIAADALAASDMRDLTSKEVEYGTVDCTGGAPCVFDLKGIDADLVVKPFQWKGSDVSLRGFTLGAFNGEIGMQPVETTGVGVDGDADGVTDEVSIDDVTATVIYMAGQTRPHTELELDDLRQALHKSGKKGRVLAAELGLPVLSAEERTAIVDGEAVFEGIGCTDCHKSQMLLDNTIFSEPSASPDYRTHAVAAGLSYPGDAVTFDLAADMLDNHIETKNFFANLANLELDGDGKGIVRLYGDLKRHDMGSGLAENIDETGHGASVWMTKELWGVGQTGQYLHDGRATTLPEAILLHGGDAETQRDAFADLDTDDQRNLVRFLQNLVILKAPEEE